MENKTETKRMLVVDDDVAFQELMKQFFSLRGWDVVVAPDAEAGIRLFRRHHPHAVILDVNLEGRRDGLSLCDQIRDDISSENTAILLVSAERRTAGDQIQGKASGADAYLLKPLPLSTLEERLKEALESKFRG